MFIRVVGTSGIVSLPEIFSGGFILRGLSHRIEGSYRGQGWVDLGADSAVGGRGVAGVRWGRRGACHLESGDFDFFGLGWGILDAQRHVFRFYAGSLGCYTVCYCIEVK